MSKRERITAGQRAAEPYPKLEQVLNRRQLAQHLSGGIVKAATHPVLPLIVYNYTSLCERRRTWDGVTTVTRGLVRDNKGFVVARPFQKFFGHEEKKTSALRAVRWTDEWYAVEKVDGTMITASNYHGHLMLATRGSFDAWQLGRVRALWPQGVLPEAGTTWVLEYVGPENRIVVEYGHEAVYGLAVLDNWSGADRFSDMGAMWKAGFLEPQRYSAGSVGELLKLCAQDGSAEGFVAVWPRSNGPSGRLKVKHPAYLSAIDHSRRR
jgi:RNA ligase